MSAVPVLSASRAAKSWEWIDPPTGPQQIPAWARGLEVDWHDGYGNPPRIKIKSWGFPTERETPEWKREGSLFFMRTDEGVFEAFSHGGRLTWHDDRAAWISAAQEGYSGRGFTIMMKPCAEFPEGRNRVILVGPWHGAHHADTQEASFLDWRKELESDEDARKRGFLKYPSRPWHKRTFCFGYFLTHDLTIRLLARFQPHLRIARVEGPHGIGIEPVKPEWDAPKFVIQERERQARLAVRAELAKSREA